MKFINIIFILSCLILLPIELKAQEYQTISQQEIHQKINELKQSNFKDTLLFSLIGFFRTEKIRFSNITENTIYVDEKGIYYQLNLDDDFGNTTISCTFFKPHIHLVPPDTIDKTIQVLSIMNEHICCCKAIVGYPIIQKIGKKFICGNEVKSEEEAENYSIDCSNFQGMEELINKYFNKGLEWQNRIKTKKELQILELTE
ncbi:MAG: hypothetical protein GX372_05425 [Ignavibacteria bacterium]|jgi:hypothetical protein|nr:hypothetical protein [Ignavibacteria bacterium]